MKNFEIMEGLTVRQAEGGTMDNRLDVFLESFMRTGWFSIEFGIFTPGTEVWHPKFKEYVPSGIEHVNLVIKDGFILNREDIPYILDILDTAGIVDALPAFDGKELKTYALSKDGNSWRNSEEVEESTFFYVSYYSVL